MLNHITLTSEQVRILQDTTRNVEVRDELGKPLGNLTLLTPEDLDDIEQSKRVRSLGKPGIPSEQVQAHFRRLTEIRSQEGMDEAKMLDLLRRMQAGEQVAAPIRSNGMQ